MTTMSASELRDALLNSYPHAAYFGAPVIGINRGDETAAAWTWLLRWVQKRSDWRSAIGIALQHAAQDGGDLARVALADFLECFQESIVLLEWTEPMAKLWPDATATMRGTSFGSPDYRLATIIAAQRRLWDMAQPETQFAAEGAGPNGDWLIVDVKTQDDFESMLAATATVDQFSDGQGASQGVLTPVAS